MCWIHDKPKPEAYVASLHVLHDVYIYMENGENRNIKAKTRKGNKTHTHAGAEKLWIQFILVRGLSGVGFVNHEYDYRSTSDDTKSTYQLIIKFTIFEL